MNAKATLPEQKQRSPQRSPHKSPSERQLEQPQQALNIPYNSSHLQQQQQEWTNEPQQSIVHSEQVNDMREREMKVIDKVMETLNSVVNQLDNMNNTMKVLEQRIDNIELGHKLK